ncbi:MAG: sterol desaturase family protein [Ilumatobacteraceae bacterium]|nr:sterol desaturase family protein [Ilumatobacteraceae bacterium]
MTTAVSPAVRADQLRTKREIVTAFFASGSPRVITTAVTVVLVARLLIGAWSWADVAVVGITVVVAGIVEWVLHIGLLHASDESWTTRTLGTGIGHNKHHLDPPDMQWLLLGPIDAAVFAVLIGIGTAAWTIPAAAIANALFGWSVGFLATFVTGLLCAYAAFAHYEWTHLLVHTRYRPKTRYYKRLARNHRLHHFRNEGYWLGITSNLGDRVMRTYPADRSDVPLSDTARTLS